MIRSIPLTRGQVALVSESDYRELSAYKWCAQWNRGTRSFYAIRSQVIDGKKVRFFMHRQVLGLRPGDKLQGEHRDRNTLNNSRDNLRTATGSQNQGNRGIQRNNTSGFKGVVWVKKESKWAAKICHERRSRYLGTFPSALEAHLAYCDAAVSLKGDFARAA